MGIERFSLAGRRDRWTGEVVSGGWKFGYRGRRWFVALDSWPAKHSRRSGGATVRNGDWRDGLRPGAPSGIEGKKILGRFLPLGGVRQEGQQQGNTPKLSSVSVLHESRKRFDTTEGFSAAEAPEGKA